MTAIEQHMLALASANEKRMAMAAFKQQVRALGTHAAADLVADTIENQHDDEVLGSFRVRPLMMCIRWLGTGKTTKCLTFAGVHNFDKRLRDLTPRQRAVTACQLRLWAAGYRT